MKCLFTFKWLTFIRLTFNTTRRWSTKACCWELVEVTEVQEFRSSLYWCWDIFIKPLNITNVFGLNLLSGEGGGLAVLGCPQGWVIFHFLRGVGGDLFWNDPYAKDAKCKTKSQALWNCTYYLYNVYKLRIPLSKWVLELSLKCKLLLRTSINNNVLNSCLTN